MFITDQMWLSGWTVTHFLILFALVDGNLFTFTNFNFKIRLLWIIIIILSWDILQLNIFQFYLRTILISASI